MRTYSILILFLLISTTCFSQSPHYRDLMRDESVSIPDVMAAAEIWFSTHPTGKGSGFKGYQRWLMQNMNAYGTSGERRGTNPYLAYEILADFTQQQASSQLRTSSLGWRDLGPYRVDSITHHYSAGGGRIENFYVDPANAQRMYVCGNYGGFWKTTDGGTTWKGTTDTLPSAGVPYIAVSPTSSDSLLIVSGLRPFMGLYRSSDGGDTWQTTAFNPVNLGLGGLGDAFYVSEVKYHPTIPNMVFASTSQGLFRSVDNFQTWSQVWTGDMRELEFHPTQSNVLYAYDGTTPNKFHVLRSVDTGLNFTLSDSIPLSYSYQVTIDVSPDCPDCLWLGTNTGFWRSLDQSQTFTQLSNIQNETQYMEVSDLDTSIILCGAVDIFQSLDGGRNFTQKTWWNLGDTPFNGPHYVHADPRDFQFINGSFYAGTDGYLSSSSDNGNTWTRYSEGVGLRESYALSVSQCNNRLSITGSQDNGSSLLLDSTWIEYYGADGMDPLAHPLNEDWFIASTQSGGRRRSIQKGQDIRGVSPFGQNSSFQGCLLQDPFQSMGAFHFGRKIYHTTNFGSTWTNTGVQPFGNGKIFEAVVAQNNPDVMYVSGFQEMKRTLDGGQTFTTIPAPFPTYVPCDMVTAPGNDSILVLVFNSIVADSQKVFLSRDMGDTWENITFNLQNMPVWSVAIDQTDEMNIYVGCQIGVFTKPLSGPQWQLYNQDLPNVLIRKLVIQHGANTLQAATYGRGLWEIPLLGRASYPCIQTVGITNPPTHWLPKEGIDQSVTSVISYADSLQSVYLSWSLDPLNLNSTINMSNTQDSTWVADTPFPNYAEGTKLYFILHAVGTSTDTSTTYRYEYTVKSPDPYCGATGWNNVLTFPVFIDSVSLGGIQHSSGYDDFYNDFTHITASLQPGNTYPLTVGLGHSFGIDSIMVWIDYNHDFVLADSEKTIMSETNASFLSTGTVQVPAYAPLGDTVRMRIRQLHLYPDSLQDPCGEYTGEVEDYSVVFRAAPNLGYQLSDSLFCSQEVLQFQYAGDPMDSLIWVFSNGATSWNYTTQSDSLVLSLPGNYHLNLTGFQGGVPYALIDSAVVNVSAISVVASSTAATVCEGDSIVLSGNGANTYSWTGGVINGQAFVPTVSTTYQLTGSDLNGCSDIDSVSIQVNALPSIGINATATDICLGDSIALSGQGGTTYTWTNGVQDGSTFAPTATSSYVVTGTDANGCVNTDSVTVQVRTTPNVSANASAATLCSGDSLILSGAGAATYAWTGGANNGQSFVPATSMTYQLTGTALNGCTDLDSVTVQVNALPSIGINASATSICLGEVVTLNGQGGTAYTWTNGVQNGLAFSPTTTMSYVVTGTDANGCANIDSVTVQVNPLPNVGINPSATSVCLGNGLSLNGTGASTYSWTGSVQNGMVFTPTNSQSYQVTGTDANGCTDTATVFIPVNPLPNVVAMASNTQLCGGEMVTLSGTGASTYAWTGGATNGLPFAPLFSGIYQVTGTDLNGCTGSDSVFLSVTLLDTSVSNTGNTLFANAAGLTYQWLDCNNGLTAIPGQNGGAFNPLTSGSYAVAISANGCMDTSGCHLVSITGLNGAANQSIEVYPNPSEGYFQIDLGQVYASIEMEVYDDRGRLVLSKAYQEQQTLELDLSQMADATYLIMLKSEQGSAMLRVIKRE